MALNVTIGDNVTEVTKVPQGCLVSQLSRLAPWNHPEDLVSYTTQQTFRKIVDVYVLTLLLLLSVPLNIVSMVVFWRHGIRERINLCLFFLSLADVIVISSHVEFKLDRLYATITNTPFKLVVAKYSINNMIHSLAGFVYISGFMSTLIALERCLCIVSPLKAQTLLQTKTTGVVIASGHIVIFGGFYMNATRWQVVCMYDPLTGRSANVYYPSQFYLDNKHLVDIFDGIFFGILLPGLFEVGVSVSTVVTVVKLRQMKEWRQQSSTSRASGGSEAKDVTLTRMLIGTNILFVICETPPLIFHLLLPVVPELGLRGKYHNTFYLLMSIQQVCFFINSSFNFFVYYFLGTKFRTTVKDMFCGRIKNRKKSNGDLQLNTAVSGVIKASST